MSKIRVLSEQLANQIAAGEVVERPASVAKELVENSIDAGARRIIVEVEGGGRRLLRVVDDGEGMTRDDALLAFERHATSKISSAEDLNAIATLGFRGEALASIASVARVELITKRAEDPAATRVNIEGGRMRDVKDAAHPQGTTIAVRDLFFNVPARRKFLRSEATENFHLANLVTHYALAHPEIAFTLTSNGRETLRAAPARDLRERAYQIFGAPFLENLLEVKGGHEQVARVRGYVSAPRERRTSRDAQYLFINGRYVRDRLISRALSEGYRAILPQGVYPAALLFLDVPLEEVDVNVHPAKTEVRFRRAAAVADAVRETVRAALATAGYVTRGAEAAAEESRLGPHESATAEAHDAPFEPSLTRTHDAGESIPGQPASTDRPAIPDQPKEPDERSAIATSGSEATSSPPQGARGPGHVRQPAQHQQSAIEFGFVSPPEPKWQEQRDEPASSSSRLEDAREAPQSSAHPSQEAGAPIAHDEGGSQQATTHARASAGPGNSARREQVEQIVGPQGALPPVESIDSFVREVAAESLSVNLRPLGQLARSYILATDEEGLLLIDQHAAHQRILFDKYHLRESLRPPESQNLLMPETFDLTPAQATAFDHVAADLEAHGFALMRLSGRTVAVKAVPADLPAGEARSMLMEVLESVDTERRGQARANMREAIAATLARRAAIKANTPLAAEKMRWLVDQLLNTSSPTTCPHGHPTVLRLALRDIQKAFHHG